MPFYILEWIWMGDEQYEQKEKTAVCKHYCNYPCVFHDYSIVCLPHLKQNHQALASF